MRDFMRIVNIVFTLVGGLVLILFSRWDFITKDQFLVSVLIWLYIFGNLYVINKKYE